MYLLRWISQTSLLCRYVVEELGNRRCKFSVSYHVVFLQSINVFVKSMLEKGVKGMPNFQIKLMCLPDGLTSNYNIYTKTLSAHVDFAAGESSVVAASVADEDLETFTPPTYDLYVYVIHHIITVSLGICIRVLLTGTCCL